MKIRHVDSLIPPVSMAIPETDERELLETWEGNFLLGNKKAYNIKIMPGFRWDGMSINKSIWSIVGSPFEPKHSIAGLVHDYLYENHITTRKEADLIMLHILKDQGESWWERKLMYRAVRIFGRMCYRKK